MSVISLKIIGILSGQNEYFEWNASVKCVILEVYLGNVNELAYHVNKLKPVNSKIYCI